MICIAYFALNTTVSVRPTFCLPWAAMDTLNWKVPLTGAVNRPSLTSYDPPMFVITRSNKMTVVSFTGPMFLERPTKNATRAGVGAERPIYHRQEFTINKKGEGQENCTIISIRVIFSLLCFLCGR